MKRLALIGNFDGVHLGHQNLIEKANIIKNNEKYDELIVLSFVPHPREFLTNDKKFLLDEFSKNKLAQIKGINKIINLVFDRKMMNMSAYDFCDKILCKDIDISGIIIGNNFRFGKNRAGDSKFLAEFFANKNAAENKNYKLYVSDLFNIEGEKVSSSLIRKYIKEGNFKKVKKLLGHDFTLCGKAIKGQQNGRKFNIPTINLDCNRQILPSRGVYFGFAVIEHEKYKNKTYKFMANCGRKPTFTNITEDIFELHIIDEIKDDLYGQIINATILHKHREEIKFPSVEKLLLQINNDREMAKKFFSGII